MINRRLLVCAAVTVLSLAACSAADGVTDPIPAETDDQQRRGTITEDVFGIPYVKKSRPTGMNWVSDWREDRSFDGIDPRDPWLDGDHGRASFKVVHGELHISGPVPRIYVRDPNLEKQWTDVEITTYFKRVKDADVPYAGMTAVARSNHGITGDETQDLCDTRGYGARLRYDGRTDFEKETSHPKNRAVNSRIIWKNGMPFKRWIGYKFLVYDLPNGNVKLETWIDDAGTKWRKVNEKIDDGRSWGRVSCAEGVDPKMVLSSSPHRKGSESGKPNLSVYFRSDGVSEDGLVYKWTSVREIDKQR